MKLRAIEPPYGTSANFSNFFKYIMLMDAPGVANFEPEHTGGL